MQAPADSGLAWGLEAAAAGGGGAAGYMEILGTLAVQHDLGAGLRIGARAALGLGGGGNVPVGGGPVAKAAATVAWQLSPRWQVGVEAGRWTALDRRVRCDMAGVWLSGQIKPAAGVAGRIVGYAWSGGVQHLTHVQRKDTSAGSLDAFCGALDWRIGERRYAKAQACSAYAGGAGAYSAGLLGVGIDTPRFASPWSAGAELAIGAAGGGGVATGGGAIAQAVAWTGLSLGGDARLRLAVGGVRSLQRAAPLNSMLIELVWTRSFGQRGY